MASNITCPNCGNYSSDVIDSRGAHDGQYIRRRRRCHECGERQTTYEIGASIYDLLFNFHLSIDLEKARAAMLTLEKFERNITLLSQASQKFIKSEPRGLKRARDRANRKAA